MCQIAILFVFLFTGITARATDLSEFFNSYSKEVGTVSKNTKEFAAQFQYVFIAGFLNEETQSYWKDVMNSLKYMGIREDKITLIKPASHLSVERNTASIGEQIQSLRSDKQMIIVAHSKGALELMNFAWKNPEFVKRNVKALFFLQGPFGGSPIGDQLYSGELGNDPERCFTDLVKLNIRLTVERLFLNKYKNAIFDLTIDAAQSWQKRLQSTMTDIHREISSRMFFITSSEDEKHLSFNCGSGSAYLHSHYIPNDGVVPLASQFVTFVGTIIGHLHADHSDFVLEHPQSKRLSEFRIAFGNALLSWLHFQENKAEQKS